MNKNLISFHGDPAIKEKYLARVKAHRAADQIVKGQYWENGKGCAVGCTIHSGNHAAYETELGIPRQLARIEDGIFESLPNGKALEWPLCFLEAIPVGVNLYPAYWKFMRWLLVDPEDGVIRFAKNDKTRAAIAKVGEMYQRQIDGGTISASEWLAARRAAYAAADAAAYAAAYAADAAAAAAWTNARIKQSEKLLELLRAA